MSRIPVCIVFAAVAAVVGCEATLMNDGGAEAGPGEDAGDPGPRDTGAPGGACPIVGDPCPGGLCIAQAEGTTGCFTPCKQPGEPCKGYDGGYLGFCTYDVQIGKLLCIPEGIKGVGEPCKAAGECVAGAHCLGDTGLMVCYRQCIDTCDTGTCTDMGYGFKVCVEEGV